MAADLQIVDCLFDPWIESAEVMPVEVDRPPSERPPSPTKTSLHCHAPAGEMLAAMDQAGVRRALVTQCRRWSCERQWLCADSRLDDVLRLVRIAPARFAGLAGYNPFAIAESVEELEAARASGGFRGVYVNAETFGMAATDNRLYPLYAKANELHWPVMMQFGINWEAAPHATTFADLLHVADDFAGLTLVAALHWWPSRPLLEQFAAQAEKVFFAVPAALLDEARMVSEVLGGPAAERLMWGSQGRKWSEAVEQLQHLPVGEEAWRGFAGETAKRVFGLRDEAPQIAAARGEAMAAER